MLTVLNLERGETLQINDTTLVVVRVSGERLRFAIRHPEGTRICKPALREKIVREMEGLNGVNEGGA